MQNHVWISLALVCFFSRAICNVKNGCPNRKLEIADKKLLLRLNWDNVTKPEILTANSANHCAQLCCEKNASCNLAEFHSPLATNNCVHMNCFRVSECLVEKLERSNGTTTYQLVEVHRGIGPSSTNVPTKQSEPSQIASRSIKSRKGVGETAATTDASSTEKQTPITTYTNTPTEEPESTTAQPLDNENATVSISTVMDGTVEATPTEDSTVKTNFPDLDADKKKHAVPRKGASDDRPWTPYSTPSSPLQPMDQQPRPPIPTKQIQSHNQSSSRGENATEFSASSHTESSSIADHPNATRTNHEHLPWDRERNSTTTVISKEPANVILQTTPSKQPPVKLVVSASIDFLSSRTTIVAAQDLDDLHFQQSVYLIVSLIIGFLVLLLVIGMVLKHVYGVWERRHYQRMDFLIDGLYNSRPAV